MTHMILTADEAERIGSAAPAGMVEQLIAEGLAKAPQDVVQVEKYIFTRAYLASGEPASFFLPVGIIHE